MGNQKIISRFAPSPTGLFQLGIIRNALYVYLLTKQSHGDFILRIDDTNPHSKKEYEKYIIDSLEWFGLDFDYFYRQSERKEIYKKYLKKLIESGHAYSSKEKDEQGEKELIRFKNPGGIIKYSDQLRGDISMDVSYLGDFIIARSIDDVTYHLASTVDDYEMGVNYVLRGEDHIPNTPKHIMIANALGFKTPLYCHLPLLLGPDKSKLSFRSGHQMDILKYKELGYLPDAILNFVLLSGWSPKNDVKPIFSKKELVKIFNVEGLQKTNAVLDINKLDWFNKQHINNLTENEKIYYCSSFLPQKYVSENKELLRKMSNFICSRINKFYDIKEMAENGSIDYFFNRPACISCDGMNQDDISKMIENLQDIPNEKFKEMIIKDKLSAIRKQDNFLHPSEEFRRILTGKLTSFDPFNIADIIGKSETIDRLNLYKKTGS
jgi:glutamyl-tRNA synthetase/nondiscriminating glutamyl-tRNA synthetase